VREQQFPFVQCCKKRLSPRYSRIYLSHSYLFTLPSSLPRQAAARKHEEDEARAWADGANSRALKKREAESAAAAEREARKAAAAAQLAKEEEELKRVKL
jgi:hypothetical protein